MSYKPMPTQQELERLAFEQGYINYLKVFFVTSLIIGACLLVTRHLGVAVDQELGIYKTSQTRGAK